jgi:hypothetical protein
MVGYDFVRSGGPKTKNRSETRSLAAVCGVNSEEG